MTVGKYENMTKPTAPTTSDQLRALTRSHVEKAANTPAAPVTKPVAAPVVQPRPAVTQTALPRQFLKC